MDKCKYRLSTHRSPSCQVRTVEIWHGTALKSNMLFSNTVKTDTKFKVQIYCLDSHVPKLEF